MRRFKAYIALAMLVAALFSAKPSAVAQAPAFASAVTAARIEAAGPRTRVTLEFEAAAPQYKTFFLSGPDRFVVDVAGVRPVLRQAPTPDGLVRGVRFAARENGARFVLDLAGPAKLAAAPAQPHPRRLTFEFSATPSAPTPKAQPAAVPQANAAWMNVRNAPPPKAGRRVVVIDAGHGGRDPGALGTTHKSREKDITLAAALRLREDLEGRGGYHVVLTRDGDAFLPLQERVKIARDNHADLFVSLHADSGGSPAAKGASVYTLSETGSNRAKTVMEAQDWDMDLRGPARSQKVESILIDLAQRETTNRSADFAQALIAELGQAGPLLRNTHRNAGFFVLLAPDVPAVLVELGFLTHADDEARLASPGERAKLMGAVADAVDAYFAALHRKYATP
jgi:N-acetylmuramoyl-L-alanine amidase